MTESGEVTGLLQAWQNGDEQALDRLSPFVYQELRRIARRYMSGENPSHTLQPTALVNEAFLRLVDGEIDYQSRKHFYVIAARMMRRVLVDHARSKNRQKRGGDALMMTVINNDQVADADGGDMQILHLDDALSRLAESDQRTANAVELVYFGGLSIDDAADVLGISKSTAYEDIRFAKAWLKNAMR